jgi:pteridine reductase
MSTSNKVALITGSARRIGAEIARTLHDKGMRIVVHYHTSEEEAQNLCDALNSVREQSAVAVHGDLDNIAMISKIAQQTIQAFGRLDVLVNNASRFYRTPFGKTQESSWQELMDTNLKAPYFLSQALAPYLATNKGCIINIADIHGEKPMRDYSVYCLSKAGLLMMTRVLAKELAPEVNVNSVSPGSVDWPEGENALSEKVKQKIIERTALLRPGAPRDIAEAVLFLVRDGQYITGQNLVVDGGRS